METSDKALHDGNKAQHKTATDGAIKKEDKSNDELNGPSGLEPTRYGDWERAGICKDF